MKGQDAEAVILWRQCLGEVVWQGCVVQWIGKPSVAVSLLRSFHCTFDWSASPLALVRIVTSDGQVVNFPCLFLTGFTTEHEFSLSTPK